MVADEGDGGVDGAGFGGAEDGREVGQRDDQVLGER